MNPYIARVLAIIAEASYSPAPKTLGLQQPDEIDELKTYGFIVRVTSNNETIMVSFRGTQLEIKPMDRFFDSAWQMITNLDYTQLIVNDEFRIHRGYWRAISVIYEDLLNTLVRHGLERKPLLITGHSAGAAMATILAFRLHYMDIAAETYVYSSPRVGDRNFANFFDDSVCSNPVPIKRFEYGLDPIPILFPLSPYLAEYASTVLEFIENFFPLNLATYKSSAVEYIHAGPLFYGDPDSNSLISSIPLSEFLAGKTINWLEERAADLWPHIFQKPNVPILPWEEIPKEALDIMRGMEAVQRISHHISHGEIKEVFLHHHITNFLILLEKLGSPES